MSSLSRTFAFGAGLFGLALSVSAAYASDELAVSLAGNTVEINAGGMAFKTYYAEDGTFESDLGMMGTSSGTWEVVDGQLCSTSESGPQPGTRCSNMEAHAVGDSWEVQGPMGPMTATLAEGKTF